MLYGNCSVCVMSLCSHSLFPHAIKHTLRQIFQRILEAKSLSWVPAHKQRQPSQGKRAKAPGWYRGSHGQRSGFLEPGGKCTNGSPILSSTLGKITHTFIFQTWNLNILSNYDKLIKLFINTNNLAIIRDTFKYHICFEGPDLQAGFSHSPPPWYGLTLTLLGL